MYCSKCGANVAEGTAFCSACGQPMVGFSVGQAAAVPASVAPVIRPPAALVSTASSVARLGGASRLGLRGILAALRGLDNRSYRFTVCQYDFVASLRRFARISPIFAKPSTLIAGRAASIVYEYGQNSPADDRADVALLRTAGKLGLASNAWQEGAGPGSYRFGRNPDSFRPGHGPLLCALAFGHDNRNWLHHGGVHGKETSAARYSCRHAGNP